MAMTLQTLPFGQFFLWLTWYYYSMMSLTDVLLDLGTKKGFASGYEALTVPSMNNSSSVSKNVQIW